MIYMRDKANEKKLKGQNCFKKNVIDELKNRLYQNAQEKKNRSPLREQQKNAESTKVGKQLVTQQFKIGKSQQQQKSIMTEQLTNIQRQEQKVIEKINENKNANIIQHENKLLRYEINRLSEKNQRLIQELNQLKINDKVRKISEKVSKNQKRKVQEHKQSYCQTEEEQKGYTPIMKLEVQRESIKSPFETEYMQIKQQNEFSLNRISLQLEGKIKIIKNLQIQKDYLSDQLMQVEKDYQKLKISLEQAYQEKEKYFTQLQLIKYQYMRLEKQNNTIQTQLSAQEETIELLNKKIQLLEDQKANLRQSIKYVQMPSGTQNVTVQILLKFLKRKQLSKYHQALMELINKYEIRISDLNINYVEEKGLREQLYNYCRQLISMVTTQKNLTLEKIVQQINKYYTKVDQANEKQIDKLLRKVKCYSIGIDQAQLNNIKMELEQYIQQLQSRLPALSEAYLQDGSSVADSYNVSVQNFQS